MAAEMKEADARKYLQRARKYHRDELDSSFTDRMRDRPIEFQRSTYNRDIYESWILQSTLDEPNAPPIGVKNTVDEEPCPEWEYFYTNKMIRGDGVPKPLSSNKREGCSCIGGCYSDINICACAARQEPYNHAVREDLHGFLYNEHGQLQEFQLPVFECNDACSCAEYCHNRVSTYPVEEAWAHSDFRWPNVEDSMP
jgi:histone-lysine N-methyltransferase SUV39H